MGVIVGEAAFNAKFGVCFRVFALISFLQRMNEYKCIHVKTEVAAVVFLYEIHFPQ